MNDYRLAKTSKKTPKELLGPQIEPRLSFDLFKSNVCHRVKEIGDVNFIVEALKKDDITKYYQYGWYPECLYLLAMVDYLSRINGLPLCNKYNELRKLRLQNTIFPSSIIALSLVAKDESFKERAIKTSIPEFIRFNIVESEIRSVY